jgi:NAD(P)-dependent dehydrogenase (short-subunit alcohol dehydrogenase family)
MNGKLRDFGPGTDVRGARVVITGGNSGIGLEAARVLARMGANVVLAVRDTAKGERAVREIRHEQPHAEVDVLALDLADLASVRSFASTFQERYAELRLLINNAGVMALPYRRTVDGFEMQFGTNHLGHFALTGLLLPSILAAQGARVVTVSSGAHIGGTIDFSNLDGARRYQRWGVYAQSKLANLLFAYELQRRFEAAGVEAISVACHPGYAATNLQLAGPIMAGSRLWERVSQFMNWFLAQSAAMGALPTIQAAVAPEINGCDYIGPIGLLGMRGYPGKVRSSPRSYDPELARRLWDVSETLTGVRYEALMTAA